MITWKGANINGQKATGDGVRIGNFRYHVYNIRELETYSGIEDQRVLEILVGRNTIAELWYTAALARDYSCYKTGREVRPTPLIRFTMLEWAPCLKNATCRILWHGRQLRLDTDFGFARAAVKPAKNGDWKLSLRICRKAFVFYANAKELETPLEFTVYV